jgi:hypothetical protein
MAAVDHRSRADHDIVGDHQVVVGQQMQNRVLQDLHPRADTHRPVAVSDIFTPAPMMEPSPTTTSPVISADSNSTAEAWTSGVLSR